MKTITAIIGFVACLCLIVGCATKPEDRRFASPTRSETTPLKSGESYLPESVDGWLRTGQVLEYAPNRIAEMVGDDAQIFLSYGVRRAWKAVYGKGENAADKVEVQVYAMRSALDAFGVFSRFRTHDTAVFDAGTEGMRDGRLAAFYNGHFFVKMIAAPDAAVDPLPVMGAIFSGHFAAGNKPQRPIELALLSEKGLIKGTESYIGSSVLGYDYLPRALTAEYIFDNEPVTSYIVVFDKADAAVQAMERCRREWAGENQYLELHQVYAPWGGFEDVVVIGHPATAWTAFALLDRYMVITRGRREAAIGQTSHLWMYLIYAVKE